MRRKEKRVILYSSLLIIRIDRLQTQIPTNGSSSDSEDDREYSLNTQIDFESDYRNNDAPLSDYVAFYEAIRSGDVERLATVISDHTTKEPPWRLNELLSQAYEDLRLKTIPMTDEMEAAVESKLIGSRFFSEDSSEYQGGCSEERIQLFVETVALIREEYSVAEVDQKFLFVAKFIARNMFILKHQLRSTYDRIPWEEMEYCLVRFISSHTTRRENNVFYQFILNKDKILRYLREFIDRLQEAKNSMNIDRATDVPHHGREIAVKNIVHDNPEFEGLYSDYKQIRDIDSLMKMSNYIQIASLANTLEREGQLIIIRVLQVLGEHLKNTLQSPKLSKTTSELLLMAVPRSTRRILIDLRESLSHSDSFMERMAIERDASDSFFSGVQSDINKIGDAIGGLLFKNRIKMIKQLLHKIVDSSSDYETERIIRVIDNVEENFGRITGSFKMHELVELENIIQELSTELDDTTMYEKQLFKEIHEVLNSEKLRFKPVQDAYSLALDSLKSFSRMIGDGNIGSYMIEPIKSLAGQILKTIGSTPEEQDKLRDIACLAAKIFISVSSRKQIDDSEMRLFLKIVYMADFGLNTVKSIEDFHEKLGDRNSKDHGNRRSTAAKGKSFHLRERISELKSFLAKNNLSDASAQSLRSYKTNTRVQAVVEMLTLDILSILDRSLENNLLFLDESAPSLTGKWLRNHLAHDNALMDIISDPATAIISNAQKFVIDSMEVGKRKIGNFMRDDCNKLRSRFNRSLETIVNQQKMFVALAEGNMEKLKTCLRNGADPYSSDLSRSALHYAAKGGNLGIVKLLLSEGLDYKVRDSDGQSALHVAAKYGMDDLVKFFIKEMNMDADDRDNNGGTPLHRAAENGHEDTVEILLQSGANIDEPDRAKLTPLHYASRNNHLPIVTALLRREKHADIKCCGAGYTVLHLASKLGYIEQVEMMLNEGANPNCRTDCATTPLHLAAINSHTRIIEVLISGGADVNAAAINGCRALHFAVEHGKEDIADALLQAGANVNVYTKTDKNTPLHNAAATGNEGIVKLLIKNGADVDAVTAKGESALHLAAQSGHARIIDIMLNHRSDINVRDIYGITPLHHAVMGGNKEVVATLLNNKADVNASSLDGFTPLHLAALTDKKEIAALLVQRGAFIEARDAEGNTPLYLSAGSELSEVLEFLTGENADINSPNGVGATPLHHAAFSGNKKAASILIQNSDSINTGANDGMTPLYVAILKSDADIAKLLIANGARINIKDTEGYTPLHLAVQSGNKEIVDMLLAEAADMSIQCQSGKTPLLYAIEGNHIEIVGSLIRNKVDINEQDGEPLLKAVACGNEDIVDLLIKSGADMNYSGHCALLQTAALTNQKGVLVKLIKAGADVNASDHRGMTPLHLASEEGHSQSVDALLDNGAYIDSACTRGTAIHLAASNGHSEIIRYLINAGADLGRKDDKNRTALELAVADGHLQVVKILLESGQLHINARYSDCSTLLHIASGRDDLRTVKYLVSEGSDPRAQDSSGSKPIHIAARGGRRDTVKFFLDTGLDVNEPDPSDRTPLHYAAIGGHLNVMKYLISEGADVNADDDQMTTPLHIAAYHKQKDGIAILLGNGAIYSTVNKMNSKPMDMTEDENIKRIFHSTERLFEAVDHDQYAEIQGLVQAGACVNAKDAEHFTPLHHAARKGYDKTVDALLRNEADPNLSNGDLCTALHYAARFSYERLVENLLSHGAIYDAPSVTGKVPVELTKNTAIRRLLYLLNKLFEKLRVNDTSAIDDLERVQGTNKRRAIMNANNQYGKTLVVVAIDNNFTEIDRLKGLYQDGVFGEIDRARALLQQESSEAFKIFERIFRERELIFGLNNPATLEMQTNMAAALCAAGDYEESLGLLQATLEKQSEMIGMDSRDALETRSTIALVYYQQRKNGEALTIFQEVHSALERILGPEHPDTVRNEAHIGMVLATLGRYEEALRYLEASINRCKIRSGDDAINTISLSENLAKVLNKLGDHDKALAIHEENLEKRTRLFGATDPATLRTMNRIAGVLCFQKKYDESLKAHREVLDCQRKRLGPNHPDTLITYHDLAHTLYLQGKWYSALRALDGFLNQSKDILGTNHPSVLSAEKEVRAIGVYLKLQESNISEAREHLRGGIHVAITEGDMYKVRQLLEEGMDINGRDCDGRTPLHQAVDEGNIEIINYLLDEKADVTEVTCDGNTPLHTAVSKGQEEIVEILLTRDRTNTLVNAVTHASGKTPLHEAVEKGRLDIVKSLLKRGAIYDIKDKHGKKPIDLANERDMLNLLEQINRFFKKARGGRSELLSELSDLPSEDIKTVMHARNGDGHTLIQVASSSGRRKDIARNLVQILSRSEN